VLFANAGAATPACRNLPGSKLRLYSTEPTTIEEHPVTPSELDRIAHEIGVSTAARTAHPLMLIIAEFDAQIAMLPRVVEARSDGGTVYCNAPSAVAIGLGVVRPRVFLIEAAAAEPCIRSALLDHAAEHSRALENAAKIFFQQQRETFAARLRELKQAPAPDQESAITAFKLGLKSFLAGMVKQFASEMERLPDEVDTPERLEALRDACGGKVREMEEELTEPTPGRPA
jgi:hypothetical protein